jgi:hypothetical protein
MAKQAQKMPSSQGLRLGLFRTLAGLLLLFALLGFVSLIIGAYLTATDPRAEGWFPPLLLICLALAILLLARVSYRALKIRSVEELREQSKSRWFVVEDSPSPDTSFERTREG